MSHVIMLYLKQIFFTAAAEKLTKIDDTEDPFPEHAEFEKMVKEWD